MPTTEQLQTAGSMYATGASERQVAAALGCSNANAHYLKHREDLQHIIKSAQINLIKNTVEKAVSNQTDRINAGSTITNKIIAGEKLNSGAVKLLELAQQCENKVLESVGIHNAHTQSIQVNNILVDNRSELSPAVERLLTAHIGKVEGQVIDVE
jgi:hypothetical protein